MIISLRFYKPDVLADAITHKHILMFYAYGIRMEHLL